MLKQIYEYEEKNQNVYNFLQRSFEKFFELEMKLKKFKYLIKLILELLCTTDLKLTASIKN